MKRLLSYAVRILRRCFYNTPLRHWRLTGFLYTCACRWIVGKKTSVPISMSGVLLKVDISDVVATAALMNGNYEPYTQHIFQALVQEALKKTDTPIVVDVGANVGVFSVPAAALNPRVQVFAFEPNPASCQLLQENVSLNHLANVTVINAAIGEKSGSVSLDISGEGASRHSIYGTGNKRLEVAAVSLDEFFSKRKLVPRLFKIDVEGYEPLVLQGMCDLLQNSPLQMILEFNPEHLRRGGTHPEDFSRKLIQQFDAVYCIDEIKRRLVLYDSDGASLSRRLHEAGCNLLLIRGPIPDCVHVFLVLGS